MSEIYLSNFYLIHTTPFHLILLLLGLFDFLICDRLYIYIYIYQYSSIKLLFLKMVPEMSRFLKNKLKKEKEMTHMSIDPKKLYGLNEILWILLRIFVPSEIKKVVFSSLIHCKKGCTWRKVFLMTVTRYYVSKQEC